MGNTKQNQLSTIELLAPAGSFGAAIAAIEQGADALYLGLKQFSARKGATNFTIEELSRLKTTATSTKIFVTINTVISEEEIQLVIPLLYELRRLQIDGIIVQDLGVAAVIRTIAPEIPLHGSTQMAVHSVYGAKTLVALGFKRVVLARELSLSEIAQIHKEVPEIELEVFVHGAMCYSISGNCLASGILLERSANRGACGQICRTWFSNDSKDGYFFSLQDRAMRNTPEELAKAGITSLKIEGRMKSPSYVGKAVQNYRHLLDRGSLSKQIDLSLKTLWNREPLMQRVLSDQKNQGVTEQYPGHRGVPGARVIEQQGNQIEVEALTDLAVRDGILWFTKEKKDIPAPRKDSLKQIYTANGSQQTKLSKGEKGILTIKNPPQKGSIVYKISSHDQQEKKVNPNSYKPYRHIIPLDVKISAKGKGVEVTIGTQPNFWISFSESIETERVEITEPRTMEGTVEDTIGRGSELFIGEVTKSTVENGIWLPKSILKRINRQWIESFHTYWETLSHKPLNSEIGECHEPFHLLWEDIIPTGILPFITDPHTIPSQVTITKGENQSTAWIPLSPVSYQEDTYWKGIQQEVNTLLANNICVAVGVNNIGHLLPLQELLGKKGVSYYLDIFFYTANRHTIQEVARFFKQEPICACYWVEGDKRGYEDLKATGVVPLIQVTDKSKIPLFISRSCYAKEVLHKACSECKKETQNYKLDQSGKRYTMYIENCVNYLFKR